MEIAPGFKKLVRKLNMSEMPHPFNEEQWLRSVAEELDPNVRQGASDFVVRVLDDEMSTLELRSLLDVAGSDYDINDEGILEFFRILKKVL